MNIKRAKQEIKDTIAAYLLKDEYGEYVIPPIRQRPVLLLGAPGIGKTQIMEQIAKECGVALVAYTITHHTRQSAIGLPFVSKKMFGGREYTVTEYTMSEIVASVYEKMEKTGLREGILFIDEINCVSETLAPAMLQFLQCKTFGSHEIPRGWIIVAAGNPPEYNKSVREFDVVTMDRVKKIEVEPDFAVWKEYAQLQQLHPAVISYLNTRTAYFYKMETTVDGRKFATPRGWEDLSQMLTVYDRLGKEMDRDVVVQYIQHETIAKDFANYLELYRKYQMDDQLDAVLEGTIDPILLKKAAHAPFDERLSVVGLLLGRCRNRFAALVRSEQAAELLYGQLRQLKERLTGAAGPETADAAGVPEQIGTNAETGAADIDAESERTAVNAGGGAAKSAAVPERTAVDGAIAGTYLDSVGDGRADRVLQDLLAEFQKETEQKKTAELLTRQEEGCRRRVSELLEKFQKNLRRENTEDDKTAFSRIKGWFDEEQDALEEEFSDAGMMLEHAFDFLEAAFGSGQEMVIFVTELNNDHYSVQFLQEYECERYYRYNRELLFDESRQTIEAKLRALGK